MKPRMPTESQTADFKLKNENLKSKTFKFLAWSLLTSLILIVAPLRAQDEEEDDFTPRSGTPPAQRTGGASRTDSKAPSIILLAPRDAAGLTTREHPVVYWYLSAATDAAVEIGINDPTQLENPVLETSLKGPHKAGLHKLDLSKLAQDAPPDKPIKLEPGVKYELVVTVLASDQSGSENPSSTCVILRLPPKDVPAPAAEADAAKRAAFYAKQGIWFDYLDAMNAAIEASPKDEALTTKRATALAAQGLLWKPDGTITEKQ